MSKRFGKIAGCLLLLLYVCAALHMLLPHAHEHGSEECSWCTLLAATALIICLAILFRHTPACAPIAIRRTTPTRPAWRYPFSLRGPPALLFS